jgi:hypothetical protein
MKSPFKVSLGDNGFEQYIEERKTLNGGNLTQINDSGSLKFCCKLEKTLN